MARVRGARADAVCAGELQLWAAACLKLTVEIVRWPEGKHTFEVLPRRRVVERTPGLDHQLPPLTPHPGRQPGL